MEEFLHLPNGHLLNLQPRPRHGKRTRVGNEVQTPTRVQDSTSKPDERHKSGGKESTGASPDTAPRKRTPTKLPLPKSFTDKEKQQSKEAPATSEQKGPRTDRILQPKRSFGALQRSSPKRTDNDRDQYWRKVKDRFEKDIPGGSFTKEKPKEYYQEAYRKIVSLANSPRQEIAKQKQKLAGGAPRGDKTVLQGPSPPTKIPNSNDGRTNFGRSAREGGAGLSTGQRKRPSNGTQRTHLNFSNSTPAISSERTDTNTDSSEHSHPSVSPISAPSSSLTEWEDKFVVNMPSAKEPNPPIMSTQQISDFQQSIEKVHKEGGEMLDPDTLPSPRTRTPEDSTNNPTGQEKTSTGLDGQDTRIGRPSEVSDSNCSAGHRRYYSPEEVGKQRFSTIWEEAPAKSANKTPATNPDGSFLGCKEINGPYDKNPDEILLFSMTDERPRMIDIPSGRSKMSKEGKRITSNRATSTSPEKGVVQEEWKPISQNLKQAQCSKSLPKTMCQEAKCRPPEKMEVSAKASMTENLDPSENTAKQHDKQKLGRKSDDVFIIIPTITRTMVTMADLRSSPKKSDAQEPTSRAAGEIISDSRVKQTMSSSTSGLRRATQNSWGKSNAPCAISSTAVPPTNPHPSSQSRTESDRTSPQRPRAIRGFIRTQGLPRPKTGNSGEPVRYNQQPYVASVSPKRDNSNSLKSASETTLVEKSSTPETISPAASISKDRVRQDSVAQEAEPIEVAELDGQQVSDTAKELFYSKITDFNTDLHTNGLPTNNKEAPSQEMMGYVRDALIELSGQLQGLYDEIMAHRHSRAMLVKIAFNNVLKMIEHCLHVLKDLLGILALYNTTGSWPKPNREDFARSLIDLCKAMVYLIALGFVMMIIGRAAGYVVLIGSWIVWFAKPFAWLLGALGRALLV
ncbi:putative NTP binding protein [Aspergillus vadensis CBS 113365]|uniref:NTP binding protein n=1 Tax=Aspergillus vadensis (strain CBS 113365 / IMI 142717 / IBT 24658) TaxID=1448311 RepID=A0A319BPJ8_ASPVC|nr:NTP binding protein [Aspergillus vadensis CBS 113365]PYH74605.1 NTP binding protein [Aspergillus vadensis CBS 113365]